MDRDPPTPSKQPDPAKPWHRHRWPWLLMVAPMAAVIWGFTTLYLAIKYRDPLVTEHAWQDGQRLQQGLPVAAPHARPADD